MKMKILCAVQTNVFYKHEISRDGNNERVR